MMLDNFHLSFSETEMPTEHMPRYCESSLEKEEKKSFQN